MLRMMKKISLLFLVFMLFVSYSYCSGDILRIDVKGNKIVSNAKIISRIRIRAGQSYNENIINEDVKNLYATGFFETVEAEKLETSEGLVVVFKVKEKPVLKRIILEGNRRLKTKQLVDKVIKEVFPFDLSEISKKKIIDIKEGYFLDEYKAKDTKLKMEYFYKTKGFSQAEVSYEINPLNDKNEVELKFIINERTVLKVMGISVLGNKSFSSGKIKRLMKTKKAWLFNRGIFKKEAIEDDVRKVTDFYKLKGFSDVEVNIDIDYRTTGIYLVVNIDEGRRYYIGKVEVEGNKDVSFEEIEAVMTIKEGSVFSEQAVYECSSRIREIYVDKGYIFSQIDPLSVFNPVTEKVEVSYRIKEDEVAYIEDIDIKGNTKTKDKVIRRELKIYPGERFDGKKVRKSKERIDNLGFFEEVRFGTAPGSKANNIDLVVDVKEAKTGYFSFGGGYSSVDEFVGFVELRQRNFDYRNFSTFTGAGQDLSLMMSVGTLTDRYQCSFTNPWIFDTPISFGFDGYKKGHKQDENVGYAYEENIKGGALRLNREFNDYLKGGIAYRFESVEITDVVSDATQELKDEEGNTDLSSGEMTLSFDSRDNVFSTSKGIYLYNNLGIFGGPFGGDKEFFKYFSQLSLYFPVINKSVIELKVRGGYAETFSGTNKIPIYERFFTGGASTIRGYRERKVGPIDSATEDPIGGESLFIGNVEYTYPLADFLKVATFFDTGNVWSKSGDFLSGSLKSSVGLGIRVKTPIGPISIDYGWPMDTEPGEETKEGRFHFNVSRGF